ncbi:MAG: heavy metal translocating P-type ATPase [Chloroflexi bacterium]|nr:heavy metal translocating P-type ATPase [Chloroflexota bacterium]
MPTLELPITGMTCTNCANTIERTLKKTAGVAQVMVNYASERALVTFDPVQTKPAELMANALAAVRKAGYDVTIAHTELPLLGMTCVNCANTIERTLRKQLGVASVSVNYASERASVDYVPGAIGIADMVAAVRKAGYDVPQASSQQSIAGSQVDAEQVARDADIADRKNRMVFGLAFALPALVLSMSNDFGLLIPAVTAFLEWVGAWWLLVGWLHITEHGGHEFHRYFGWLLLMLTTPVMLYTAKPYFVHGYKAIRNGAANMDVLVALGSGVSFIYSVLVLLGVFSGHVYFETAAMIVALISIGKYIEALAKGRTSAAIKSLMALRPKTANKVMQGQGVAGDRMQDGGHRGQGIESEAAPTLNPEPSIFKPQTPNPKPQTLIPDTIEIAIDQIQIGDVILVKPGERIATDGIVIEGRSAVDESMITGESMPRDKKPGDAVIGATVNKEGVLKFEANKIGKDTALANIVRLVEQAQGSKAPIQALADKVSAIFVPAVLIVAALTFLGWLLIGRAPLETALINAIAVLVIACPCALGLATPTAIMVGMGKGAENGILFKNSAALERAAEIKTVVLDKTGTITNGEPVVTDILDFGFWILDAKDENAIPNLLQLSASAEKPSEHPLAQAIVRAAEAKGMTLLPVKSFLALPGKGITAYVSNMQLSIGNARLMQQHGVEVTAAAQLQVAALQAQGKTAMFVAINNQLAGLIAMSDTIKASSAEAVAQLRADGVRVLMLTGDNAVSAQAIAAQAGVDGVVADVLPSEKAEQIENEKLKMKNSRPPSNFNFQLSIFNPPPSAVAMVGDGINDAPALAQADVGIAIGTGTDVAMEAADVTLISGDLRKVGQAIRLSALTVRGIRQNLFWAFFYNVILIPIAIAGVFAQYGPILAAGAMAFSSLFVVGNSLRLRRAKIE